MKLKLTSAVRRALRKYQTPPAKSEEIEAIPWRSPATAKAEPEDYLGRFREIISDPINLLIRRVPDAGSIRDGLVTLHNGHRVAISGNLSYYGKFSEILVLNRGVHEPLEEFVFQEVLKEITEEAPTMLELGAYWGHYSMWLKQVVHLSRTWLVEPEECNLEAGRTNFARHGYEGHFIRDFVSSTGFAVSRFLAGEQLSELTILHCDIQGYETEMIEEARDAFAKQAFRYVFISTQSQEIHSRIRTFLDGIGYRVEVSSDWEDETTSYDGFILATAARVRPVFGVLNAFSRSVLIQSRPEALVEQLNTVLNQRPVQVRTSFLL